MRQSVINTSNEQVDKLFSKHLKPFILPKIISYSFIYDQDDDVGYVTLKTIRRKKIMFQFKNNVPMFAEFTGFGSIRYVVEKINHREMFNLLYKYGMKAQTNFWNGGQI